MNNILARALRFIEDEEGASAAESGVLATLIVIVCVVAASVLGIGVADAIGPGKGF